MMSAVSSEDIPIARVEMRGGYRPYWIVLTAYRAGSEEPVTVEIDLGDWMDLPPVQYVVRLHLSKQQPRCPRRITNDSADMTRVPCGHIEWKDGQNWVVVTANRVGIQEAVTLELTLAQWLALRPVRDAVEDVLENWHDRKMPKW